MSEDQGPKIGAAPKKAVLSTQDPEASLGVLQAVMMMLDRMAVDITKERPKVGPDGPVVEFIAKDLMNLIDQQRSVTLYAAMISTMLIGNSQEFSARMGNFGAFIQALVDGDKLPEGVMDVTEWAKKTMEGDSELVKKFLAAQNALVAGLQGPQGPASKLKV
jgi:hypothetical protein